MTKLNDETLMLFADGLLEWPERDRVGRLVSDNPELRAQVDVFRRAGPGLARLFDEHMNSPLSPRLQQFVDQYESAPAATGSWRAGGSSGEWRRWLHSLRDWNSPLALAASVSLVAGLGLGWLLRGGTESDGLFRSEFVQLQDHRLVAQGKLHKGLESVASGGEAPLGGEAQLRVKMTFQNEARDYCRQYEIVSLSRERHAGVACRVGSQWRVAMQALMPPSASAGRTTPAGAGSQNATDAAVSALIDGDPIVGEEEIAIMRKGWRK
jgi:hypothetical protein